MFMLRCQRIPASLRNYLRFNFERSFAATAAEKQTKLIENHANFPSIELYYKHLWNKANPSYFITNIEYNTFMNLCVRPFDILYVRGLTNRLESIVQDFDLSMSDAFIAACIRLGHPEVACQFLCKWSCRIGSWTSRASLVKLIEITKKSGKGQYNSLGERLAVLCQLSAKGVDMPEDLLVDIIDEFYNLTSPVQYATMVKIIRDNVIAMRVARGMSNDVEAGVFLDPLKPIRRRVFTARTPEQLAKKAAASKKKVAVASKAVAAPSKEKKPEKKAANSAEPKAEAKSAGKGEAKPTVKADAKPAATKAADKPKK